MQLRHFCLTLAFILLFSLNITAEDKIISVNYPPDMTVREYFDGGMKTTWPNGETSSTMFSTQAPVAIPPGVPGQAQNLWLDSHSEGLLNILKDLVNYDQAAIDNYIAYEGNGNNIYESIQLRRKTISLLLR
jgi:hypothetical protein